MKLLTQLRRLWLASSCRRSRPRSGRRTRCLSLRLEPLENRLVPSDGTTAGTVLVKDINPGPGSAFATGVYQPKIRADVNGTLFFAASDGTSGVELWKSDGTAAGTSLVKDINPGSAGSYPTDLVNVKGTLFFDAGGPNGGLWRSDGTAAGTVLVSAVGAGDLTNVNGTLFFGSSDGTSGVELWKSDGTAAGTVMVKDINARTDTYGHPYSSFPQYLTNVNGTLFFSADDGTHGRELWKSDGTTAGTIMVKDIFPSPYSNSDSRPEGLTNVNGMLFFSAYDGTSWQVWKSDGTAAGTVMLSNISPALSPPEYLTNVNGTLFFAANDGNQGEVLWKSDGTAAGTKVVSTAMSDPGGLTNVNGTLFFRASDPQHGDELWKSDGTRSGTVLVQDINPGSTTSTSTYLKCTGQHYPNGYPKCRTVTKTVTVPNNSKPSNLTNANGTLFFVADDGTHGREIWKSDGTSTGTVLVKDINPGSAGSNPASLTVSGGHLFFSADDGVHGTELWDPPILPAPGSATIQTPDGLSSSGDNPPLSPLLDEADVAVAVLSMAGRPLSSQWQDGTHSLADDFTGSAPVPVAHQRSTGILDQIFAEAPLSRAHLALPLARPWNPDLLEDLAFGWQLG